MPEANQFVSDPSQISQLSDDYSQLPSNLWDDFLTVEDLANEHQTNRFDLFSSDSLKGNAAEAPHPDTQHSNPSPSFLNWETVEDLHGLHGLSLVNLPSDDHPRTQLPEFLHWNHQTHSRPLKLGVSKDRPLISLSNDHSVPNRQFDYLRPVDHLLTNRSPTSINTPLFHPTHSFPTSGLQSSLQASATHPQLDEIGSTPFAKSKKSQPGQKRPREEELPLGLDELGWLEISEYLDSRERELEARGNEARKKTKSPSEPESPNNSDMIPNGDGIENPEDNLTHDTSIATEPLPEPSLTSEKQFESLAPDEITESQPNLARKKTKKQIINSEWEGSLRRGLNFRTQVSDKTMKPLVELQIYKKWLSQVLIESKVMAELPTADKFRADVYTELINAQKIMSPWFSNHLTSEPGHQFLTPQAERQAVGELCLALNDYSTSARPVWLRQLRDIDRKRQVQILFSIEYQKGLEELNKIGVLNDIRRFFTKLRLVNGPLRSTTRVQNSIDNAEKATIHFLYQLLTLHQTKSIWLGAGIESFYETLSPIRVYVEEVWQMAYEQLEPQPSQVGQVTISKSNYLWTNSRAVHDISVLGIPIRHSHTGSVNSHRWSKSFFENWYAKQPIYHRPSFSKNKHESIESYLQDLSMMAWWHS